MLAGVYEHSCVGLEWGYHYQCVCVRACVHVGVYACMSVGSRGSSQCLILLLLVGLHRLHWHVRGRSFRWAYFGSWGSTGSAYGGAYLRGYLV